MNLFHTSLPGLGPGAIRPRQEAQLYNTEKERTLFASQDPFYRQVGEELADAGIGCNLFLFPSQYIDVASLGVLTGITGGELYFHPRFDPVREGRKLRSEIVGAVSRETAYSVTMRVRCSNGLRVADHFGNFFQRNMTDLEFGTLDADKAIAAVVKHDGKLSENQTVYFQCAVLYTSSTGQRRVRCHNLALGVSTKLGDVFRVADMGATISIVAKEAITQTLTKSLKDVRETMTDACVKTLFAYRKWCAGQTSPGQLILPESYKLFPIYALGLMKTKALKGSSPTPYLCLSYTDELINRWIGRIGCADVLHAPDQVHRCRLNARAHLPQLLSAAQHGASRVSAQCRRTLHHAFAREV